MGKEPSIFYFLETEIHSTGKRRTLNSSEKACNNLKWIGHFEVWPSPLGICTLGTLTHGGVFGIKCLYRGGRVEKSFTFLAPYIGKFCGIVVFGKFSCGTYVIVVLNSDIVVFLNIRIFSVIGSVIFSTVEVVEFFDFSFRGYGVQYTPSRFNSRSNLNFWACVYFHYKTIFTW